MIPQLKDHGYAVIAANPNVTFLDQISSFATPHDHNGQGAYLWDIQYQGKTNTLARSHTSLEFPLHTDCSYEDQPPHYFALHVIQDDKLGGGLTQLVDVGASLHKLSDKTAQTLRSPYPCIVPREFYKGSDINWVSILFDKQSIKFRRECIKETLCTPEQLEALNELEDLIKSLKLQELHLQQNQIILIDNYRLLHGRTKVLDKNRHLQRIRFNITGA